MLKFQVLFFPDINWHFLIFFCVVGSDNHLFGNRGSEQGDGSAMGRATMRPRLRRSSPSLFPVYEVTQTLAARRCHPGRFHKMSMLGVPLLEIEVEFA